MDLNEIVVNPAEVQRETDKTLRQLLDKTAPSSTSLVQEHADGQGLLEITQEQFDKLVDEDFFAVHTNLKALIDKGSQSLNSLLTLAAASDHPRAYEVAATFLKTLSDLNKDLLDSHTKRREAKSVVEQGPTVNNQNLFVGSASEAIKMLKEARANT